MNALLHRIADHPFVSMSAFAALVHSTWSLGTMFSGAQPVVVASAIEMTGEWLRQTVQLVMWLTPALSLALAIDVGLVESAHAVRSGRKQHAAFVVLALGSYFLQLIYIAHHFPDVQLSSALSERVRGIVELARDFAVLIVPALLQLPIILYVFGGADNAANVQPQTPIMRHEHVLVHEPKPAAIASTPPPPSIAPLHTHALPQQVRSGTPGGAQTGEIDVAVESAVLIDDVYVCNCPRCNVQIRNADRAKLKRSLAAHFAGDKCKTAYALKMQQNQEATQ